MQILNQGFDSFIFVRIGKGERVGRVPSAYRVGAGHTIRERYFPNRLSPTQRLRASGGFVRNFGDQFPRLESEKF